LTYLITITIDKLSAYALPVGLSVPRVGRGLRAVLSVRQIFVDWQ